MDLEGELQQKLFSRGNRKIELTPEGVILKKRAEEVIELIEKAENELKSSKNEISGNIFIGSGETRAIKLITDIIKNLKTKYPKIKFHIVSGDSEDLQEKLDKGLLDFCILIEPIDLDKYNSINLKEKDRWGLFLRKDDILAKKKNIKLDDLLNLPLIMSRQAIKTTFEKNIFIDWFKGNFEKLNIVGTYNLIYNASIMTEDKIGYAMGLDRLINTMDNSKICFRPLSPKLEVNINIVWKKNQIFSKPAKIFFEELNKKFNKE